MPVIDLVTQIAAPVGRVFDLACSIDLHVGSNSDTGEEAIAGVTTGLIGPGDTVTWRAQHFGRWQTLTVRITEFDRPNHFTDIMVSGAFRRMHHQHIFECSGDGTLMRDVFTYEAPFSFLGVLADALFLESYMRSFLVARNRVLKSVAESDDWRRYLARRW